MGTATGQGVTEPQGPMTPNQEGPACLGVRAALQAAPRLSLLHPEPHGLMVVQKVPGNPEPPAAGGLQGRLPGPVGRVHGAARGGPCRAAEARGAGGGDGPAAPARHEQDGGSLGGRRLRAPYVLRAVLGVMSWPVSAGTGDEPGGLQRVAGTGGDVRTPRRLLRLGATSRARRHPAAAGKLASGSISWLRPGRGFHRAELGEGWLPPSPPGLVSSGCFVRAVLGQAEPPGLRDVSFCPAGWEQGGPRLARVREEEEGEQGKGSGSVPRAGEPGGLQVHGLPTVPLPTPQCVGGPQGTAGPRCHGRVPPG